MSATNPTSQSSSTFYFLDGAGPVPAHRHANPDGTTGGWVADTASVAPTVYVGPDAQVFDFAHVYDRACIYGSARVYGSAHVSGDARVSGDAEVYGNALVSGNARVFGDAEVYGNARVYDDAQVFDSAHVFGSAQVFGDAQVSMSKLGVGEWGTSPFQVQIGRYPSLFDGVHFHVGCCSFSLTEWQDNVEKIGKENGATEEEIKMVRKTVIMLQS